MDAKPKKDAFVLSGGGARAAYQLGVLKYVFTEMNYQPEAPIFVGTSAGAINTFYLAMRADAGLDKAIVELCDLWSDLTINRIYKTDVWSILKTIGNFAYNFTLGPYVKQRHVESVLDTTPLYFFLRSLFDTRLHRLHENIEKGKVSAVGINAMQYGTGKNFTFYETSPDGDIRPWFRPKREGQPTKLRLKHVLASAAIPLLFPSVKLGNHFYGDGSVRKMAPLSPAIQLGASRILAIGLRPAHFRSKATTSYPSVSQIVGMMFNTIFLDALDHDVHTLERLNGLLESAPHVKGLRPISVKLVQPTRDLGLLSLPYKKFIPRALSFLVQGLGPIDQRGADFLSYILFEGHYTKLLIKQGFEDAHAQRHELQTFFSCPDSKKKVA